MLQRFSERKKIGKNMLKIGRNNHVDRLYLVSVYKVGYFVDRPCIFSPKGYENAFFKVVCL